MGFFQKHREGVLYVLFGVLTTLVNFLIFLLFDLLLGEGLYLVSNAIAWCGAVLFAFFTNKLLVFGSQTRAPRRVVLELGEFVLARVFSLAVEELGLFLLVDLIAIPPITLPFAITLSSEWIAKILLAIVVVLMNYFFGKFIIFKKEKK